MEHCFAIGDLIVTDLNAIPRPIKYIGATEVYVEDEHHATGGEWLPVSFIEPYTVASGCDGAEDGIPDDAWAFRLRRWDAATGEQLVGAWHRTAQWVRRDGTYSGLVSVCNRVYNGAADMELVGAPEQHPIGYLCVDCFGVEHSDKVVGGTEVPSLLMQHFRDLAESHHWQHAHPPEIPEAFSECTAAYCVLSKSLLAKHDPEYNLRGRGEAERVALAESWE